MNGNELMKMYMKIEENWRINENKTRLGKRETVKNENRD